MEISFLLNGESVELSGADPTGSVLDWLRESRGLRGTKEGCNEGDCGACTVIVTEGGISRPVNSCLAMLGQLDGKALTTVEGLTGPDGTLHPVQQALIDQHGSQCGFCTPGIAMSLAAGHLYGGSDHDDQLAGNLCRCTGYAPIVRAAETAAKTPAPDWFRAALAQMPARADAPQPGRPTNLDALADLMMQRPQATLINGGTDQALRLTKGLERFDDVIFLDAVRELKLVSADADSLRIGTGVSIERLRGVIEDDYPAFAEMLRRFASAQIRSVATLGGNIGNGSPVADTPPVLIALGARLHLRRGDARRDIPLENYYVDYGRQDRRESEFLEAVTIPVQPDRLRVYKVSKRFDQDITTALGAFNITVKDGKVQDARIAFGGMAGTPKRARAVETALIGADWSRETVAAAGQEFAQDYAPLSDLRGSADYRLDLARNMLLRAWIEDQGQSVSALEVNA